MHMCTTLASMFSLAADACGTRLHAYLDSMPIAVRCLVYKTRTYSSFFIRISFTYYSRIILDSFLILKIMLAYLIDQGLLKWLLKEGGGHIFMIL